MAAEAIRSGELARAAGVSSDTLRHYERRGLLPRPRRLGNGYRAYPPEALDRVVLIQRALSVGFTLDELARFLRARARGAPPCREVRALAAEKLREIDRRLEELPALPRLAPRDARGVGRTSRRSARRRAREVARIARRATRRPCRLAARRSRVRPPPPQKGEAMKISRLAPPALSIALVAAGVFAQTPPPSSSESHHGEVDSRGDSVMGFDHEKTTHHFRLSRTGGAIEASANRADDLESRDAIRMHFSHIARMFSKGNFNAPMLIHDRVPPGVDFLKGRPSAVRWRFRETERGAVLEARTKDPRALAAVHDFLRFQIEDHRTGDPMEMPDERAPRPR